MKSTNGCAACPLRHAPDTGTDQCTRAHPRMTWIVAGMGNEAPGAGSSRPRWTPCTCSLCRETQSASSCTRSGSGCVLGVPCPLPVRHRLPHGRHAPHDQGVVEGGVLRLHHRALLRGESVKGAPAQRHSHLLVQPVGHVVVLGLHVHAQPAPLLADLLLHGGGGGVPPLHRGAPLLRVNLVAGAAAHAVPAVRGGDVRGAGVVARLTERLRLQGAVRARDAD
mmetsp:Transcript_27216/g.46204  ORF Transcript_27216/g.46204 Transcript_27216/m.46204 type:complete len:223 (+) Transcript_27216:531-1199(+)